MLDAVDGAGRDGVAAEALRIVPERDLAGGGGVRDIDGRDAGAGVALVAEEDRVAVAGEGQRPVASDGLPGLVIGEVDQPGRLGDVEDVEALLPLVAVAAVDA